jgi:hypothetical protein
MKWVKEEQITFEDVPPTFNPSESLSKPTQVESNPLSTEKSLWDADAHSMSALSKPSRSSLAPLTEAFLNCSFLTLRFRQVRGSERGSRNELTLIIRNIYT